MSFNEDVEDLLDRKITEDDLKRGLYFHTSLKGFYMVLDKIDIAPLITVYETATFPTDGYDVPSVKRIADVCFPEEHDNLRNYCKDMLTQCKTRYLPEREMEDWEIEQLKNAIPV